MHLAASIVFLVLCIPLATAQDTTPPQYDCTDCGTNVIIGHRAMSLTLPEIKDWTCIGWSCFLTNEQTHAWFSGKLSEAEAHNLAEENWQRRHAETGDDRGWIITSDDKWQLNN